MNKSAVKNFSIWARQKLIEDIKYRAGMLGVSEDGIAEKLPQSTDDLQFFDIGTKNPVEISGVKVKQRQALVNAVRAKERASKSYSRAFESVVEEVAYTWFNRLIAIRFMEVNGYLPSGLRVLSSEKANKNEPDFVTAPFETDLDFTQNEQDIILRLKNQNKTDELFRMLFIKQCNKLNEILPELFENTGDYTELLLTISFTDKDGILYHLVHDIDEADFNIGADGQVEIIGWLYQYYNTEPKQAVFDGLKKNVKISRDNIPAATQLFTPDWIVRYMVENSVGRVFVNSELANQDLTQPERIAKEKEIAQNFGWNYYIPGAEQAPEVYEKALESQKQSAVKSIEDISICDPCMGSSHILLYAFDILMRMYVSKGYSERDAARFILKNNLYGLDIDRRAYQLAYFALMMKARQYDRRIFSQGIAPQVYCPGTYEDGMEYGSLIKVDKLEPMPEPTGDDKLDTDSQTYAERLNTWNFRRLLNQKYNVVVTNPPYMGSSGMNAKLSEFIKKNYPDGKSDISTAFMEQTLSLCKPTGIISMINIPVWMFISSYENLRKKLLEQNTIINMVHPGRGIFGSDFGTVSFVISKVSIKNYKGTFYRLFEKQGEVKSIEERENAFLCGKGCFTASADNFSKIPGSPVAYWVGEGLLRAFETGSPLGQIAQPRQGLATADNNRFLRQWFEVNVDNIGFSMKSSDDALESGLKWFPYNKGGEFRKWYGNNDFVVNWENDGFEIRNFYGDHGRLASRPQNTGYYFKESITWSKVSSGSIAFRYKPNGNIFDVSGTSIFTDSDNLQYIHGFCNSNAALKIANIVSPTLNYEVGHIASFPIIQNKDKQEDIIDIVNSNISLSRADWDAFETSWDFKRHPLLPTFNNAESQDNLIEENRKAIFDQNSSFLIPHSSFDPNSSLDQNSSLDRRHPLLPSLENSAVTATGAPNAEKSIIEENRTAIFDHNSSFLIPNSSLDQNSSFLIPNSSLISASYKLWEKACDSRFNQLKKNEEELNRLFIEIYGLQNELSPEVEDKDVTVRKADLTRDIKSLISYAVGCMFGRYSPLKDGLMFAGGKWDIKKFQALIPGHELADSPAEQTVTDHPLLPDPDNVIPICDEDYFKDDITEMFVNWVRAVYGADTLDANLKFIAGALGGSGTPRETIRKYFLNDFYKDHVKTYKKRPIYWLFDSGKQNGFKALCYMHRYNADTVGNMRVDYLHRLQRAYEKEIARMQEIVDGSNDSKEISNAVKRRDKLQKQLKETKEYDAKVGHIALSRINIDLDDGVKVNYEKVQTARDGRKMEILYRMLNV